MAEYSNDAILNVDEAAKYLKVSTATVRQHCHLMEGEPDRLPNFRLGTAIRIPYWALLTWVAARSGCSMPPAPSSDKQRRRRIIRTTRTRRTPARR